MVNFFRNASFARGLSFILATSLVTSSCAKKEIIELAPQSKMNSYSGEQLFKGIFLLDGEVAAKLPAMQGLRMIIEKENSRNPSYIKLRDSRNQQIVNAVRALDPNYLNELKTAVTSQQFDEIEVSMRKGSSLLKSACLGDMDNKAQIAQAREIMKDVDLSKFNFSKPEDAEKFVAVMDAKKKSFTKHLPDQSTTPSLNKVPVDVWFAFDVAVAIEVAAIFAIAWVVPVTQTASGAFEHETLIKDIALNLN